MRIQEKLWTKMNTIKNIILNTEKYEKIKSELSKLEDKKQDLKVRRDKIKIFIDNLKNHNEVMSVFDEKLWYAMVDKVVVRKKENIEFQFRNSN